MSYNELRRDIFGQSDSQSAGIPYDDFKKSRLKPEADRQSAAGFGALGNVGVTAGKAAVNAGQVLVGAADTISDGRASQALSNVGYDPERTHQALDARYVQPAHEAEAGAVRSYAAIPFLKGTAGIGGAAGAGLEMLGEGIGNDRLQGVGRGLQDSAMRVQENLTQRQSQSAQEDAQKTIFGEDGGYGGYNFGTLSQQAFESLPGTIAMGMAGAPVAGAVTRGSAKLGVGKALSPLKGGSGPLSSAVSKGIDTAIGSGVGFGLSEGVFSGLSEAAGIQHEIRNTPVEDMAKHPMFAETFEQTSPDKPHEQRLLETREALARRAGDQTFARTALTTGLISGVTGGGVFGMLRGGTQTKGVLKNIWEGIKKEGLQQELPQSAFEQLHGNMAKRDFVDESQRIFENVIEAGIQGGLVGAVMGGLGGGASVHPAQQIIQDVHQKNLAEHNGDQAAAEQATVETLIKLDRAFESAAKSPDESAVQPEPAAASIETGPETGPETGASMPKAQGMENPFAAIQTQADLKRRIIDTRDQIKKAGDKDGSLAAGLQQDEARFNELSSALDEWSNTDSGRQHQRQSEALKQSLNEGDIVRHALLGDVKVANIGRTLATVQTAAGEIANVPYGALLEKADAGLESSDIAASGTEAVTGTVEGLESSALGIPSASQPGPVAGTQNAGTPNQTDTTVPQDGLVPLDTQTGAVVEQANLPDGDSGAQGQVAPLNSIRSEQAQTGSSAADVQGWLPNRAKKLLDTGKLRVEQSAANVPQTAEAIDAGGIEGFYDRDTDTMYLIADQLTQENLPSVLAHESLHRAEATDPKLQASIGRFEQQLDNSFKHAAAGLGSDIEKAGFRRVMEANTEPAAQLEEYRAYLVSEYMRNPETLSGRVRKAIEDFIASIRVALIRSGLDMGFIRQLTPADLAAMSRYGMKVGSAKATSENAGTGMLPSASSMKSVEANVSRGRTAMTQALLNKATEHRAMFRTGMGWVDFVWGDEGKAADARGRRKGAKGLAHILEARQRKDGLTDAQAKNLLFNLVETIARGKEGEVYQQGNAQSMAITDGKHRVLLAKKSGSNAWMVTGYEIYPDGASSASDALAPTHSESTPSRNGMGAGNNKITDSKKSSTDKLKFSRASNSNDTRASALRKAGLVKDADNRTLLAKADDWRKDFKRQWDNVYKERLHEGMFDRLRGIYAAERDLLGGVTAEQSGYVSARLSTGSSSIIYGMLLKGAPKWDGSASRIEMAEGTKGLTDIFGRAGNDLDAFFAWMIGRRAERLMKEGRENNFTEAEIRELIAMGQGKEALFLSIRKEYNDFKKHVLDVAERGGLIDAEGRKSWDSGDYIPFYRALDKGGVKGPRNNRGFSHQTSGIKQLRGGTAALGDPLENIVKNFAHLIDASVKNNAIRKVADNFDGTGILEEIPRVEFTRALVPMAQFRKLLIEAEAEKIAQASGVDQAEAMQQAKAVIDLLPQDALEGFRQMAAVRPPSDPDVVRVMDGGKSHYYRVHDEALLRGLTALDQRQDNGFIRIMRGFKRVLTTGVTSDPTFMVRNFIRDAGHAWVINNDGFRLGIDSLRGAQKALSEKGGAIDMMFSGASFIGGYINGNDPEATAQAIRRVLAKQGLSRTESDSFMKTVTANSQALWERYRHVGDKIENASREAVYEAAIKAGKSKTQALFESKDLMDYSMQGNFMIIQFLGDVLPFFNARLQGLYKLGRTGVLTRHVAQRGLMVAGASIALLALNGDDERYEELEDWDKDMFWHVFLGGEHIRIPKPFEVGLLYGSVPERMMRNLLGKDDTKKSAQRLAWMILETFAMEPIPQAVKPLEEVIRNQDSFTNRPIENLADEGKLPSARYSEHTSDTMRLISRGIGDATGLSPKRLEHLYRGYLGSLGMYVLAVSDAAVRSAQGKTVLKTDIEAADIPMVKAFATRDVPRNTRYKTELYDMASEVERIYRTVNAQIKEGDRDAAREYFNEGKDKLKNRETLKSATKQLKTLRAQIDALYRNPNLSRKQRTERIDALNRRGNEIAKRAVEMIERRR